jgi:hypothetical protein
LGIALIAMGEEIGSEMAFRTFGHLVSRLCIGLFFIVLPEYKKKQNADSKLFDSVAEIYIFCSVFMLMYI